MTALATVFGTDRIGDAVAQTNGYSAGLLGAAGIAAAGALVTGTWLRGQRPQEVAPTSQGADVVA
jgi:hypothetical protein